VRLRKEAEKLLKLEGVAGISVREDPAVRVFVERIEPRVLSELPEEIEGRKLEIIETGRISILLSPEEKQSVVRPLVPGISVGSELVTAGTIGQICVDEDGELAILSNYHVLYGDVGTKVLSPGPYDGGTEVVGYVKEFVPLRKDAFNLVDCAIASIEKGIEASNCEDELGFPTGMGEAREGDILWKSGRTTCVTSGKVLDTSATIKVHGYPEGAFCFDDVIVTSCMAYGGDSGSAAFNSAGEIVGLVFAGSDKITVICKIQHVCRELKIRLITGPSKIAAPKRIRAEVLLPLTFGIGMYTLSEE